MKTILLSLLLMSSVCEAGTLLVPSSHSAFDSYHKLCRRQNYICSLDYFTKILAAKPTPNFDFLLDQLDLSSSKSMDSFRNRLIHILNTEEISLLQLQMLLEVVAEMNRLQPTVYFDMVEGELRRLQSLLQRQGPISPAKFVFIFKRRFPLAEISQLQTSILKIPYYVLHYSSLPIKTNTSEAKRPAFIALTGGKCGHEVLTAPVARARWKIQTDCEKRVITEVDSENRPESRPALRHTL